MYLSVCLSVFSLFVRLSFCPSTYNSRALPFPFSFYPLKSVLHTYTDRKETNRQTDSKEDRQTDRQENFVNFRQNPVRHDEATLNKINLQPSTPNSSTLSWTVLLMKIIVHCSHAATSRPEIDQVCHPTTIFALDSLDRFRLKSKNMF
jgi:hypothetical protein